MEEFFLFYHHIEIQGMTCHGDDNSDPHMEQDTGKDNHQLTKNQSKHHHADKGVKHIEIQLEILMCLLKQYK